MWRKRRNTERTSRSSTHPTPYPAPPPNPCQCPRTPFDATQHPAAAMTDHRTNRPTDAESPAHIRRPDALSNPGRRRPPPPTIEVLVAGGPPP